MDETIKAFREGNHLSFEQLFDNCYESLCRYAYSILKDMDEAEDIVQKTLCKLWDQREMLDIRTSVKSYLYRIVHNECLNTVHQQINHKTHNLNYLSAMNSSVDDVNEHIATSELQQRIDKALTKLPTQCKRVFEMSRMEQLSYSEISKNLGISINTVENQVSKALKIFRIELKDFLTLCFFLKLFN